MYPCNNAVLWGYPDPEPMTEGCNIDQKAQQEYLGGMQVEILANVETLSIADYGPNKIRKEAKFFEMQVD